MIAIVSRGFARNTEPPFVKHRHIDDTEQRLVFVEKCNEAPECGSSGDETLSAVDRIYHPRPGLPDPNEILSREALPTQGAGRSVGHFKFYYY